MVDSAAVSPGGGMDPGGPRRHPGKRHKRHRPPPPHRGPRNPPSIDIQEASSTASPVEERPADVSSNAHAVYSTGAGQAEMYHYDRQPQANQEAMANQLGQAEVSQVKGPGQA